MRTGCHAVFTFLSKTVRMRRSILPVAIVLVFLPPACRVAPPPDAGARIAADSAVVVVTGPTFVGFFPPVTEAQTAADESLNSTLDDFGWHLSAATTALRARGYAVEARFADTLHFRSGARRWRFVPPDSARIGYYLVAPGRAPLVVPHVHTDDELVELGTAYLRGPAERSR